MQMAAPRRLQRPWRSCEPKVSDAHSAEGLIRGRHFDRPVIVLRVRWSLRNKLSFRDLLDIVSERGLRLAHTTMHFEEWTRFREESTRCGTGFSACNHRRRSLTYKADRPSGMEKIIDWKVDLFK